MSRLWKSTIGGVAVATMIAAGSLVAAARASADPGYYGAKVYQVGQPLEGRQELEPRTGTAAAATITAAGTAATATTGSAPPSASAPASCSARR